VEKGVRKGKTIPKAIIDGTLRSNGTILGMITTLNRTLMILSIPDIGTHHTRGRVAERARESRIPRKVLTHKLCGVIFTSASVIRLIGVSKTPTALVAQLQIAMVLGARLAIVLDILQKTVLLPLFVFLQKVRVKGSDIITLENATGKATISLQTIVRTKQPQYFMTSLLHLRTPKLGGRITS
jgi:hypothetical protein